MEDTCLGCSASCRSRSWYLPLSFVLCKNALLFSTYFQTTLHRLKTILKAKLNGQIPKVELLPSWSCMLGHTDQQLTIWPYVELICWRLLPMCVFTLQPSTWENCIDCRGRRWETAMTLHQFWQGFWCAWESSGDFSKILGLLAGRRFLQRPIILLGKSPSASADSRDPLLSVKKQPR